jgi:hypothetical protein
MTEPRAEPYSLFESYVLFNCWFCAIALFFPHGNPYFGGRGTPPDYGPLFFLTIINAAALTATIYWVLSRRGRRFSPRDLNFAVPVVLYGLATLASGILWLTQE